MSEEKQRMPLLTPLKVGQFELSHRIVLPALCRCRSWGNLPQPHAALYYSQRATNGGLLISEPTAISHNGIGLPNIPGIWSKEQVDGWKPIVKAVHDKGAVFFCQIWHAGRVIPYGMNMDGEATVSSSDKKLPPVDTMGDGDIKEYPQPRALALHEIPDMVDLFRVAALNAIEAGFDGVQINGGHGYLIDQFFKDSINNRTDEYGGSVENRCRFAMEVLDAVINAIGAGRVSIKLSPYYSYIHCADSDPDALCTCAARLVSERKILFLDMTESIVATGDGTYGYVPSLHLVREA